MKLSLGAILILLQMLRSMDKEQVKVLDAYYENGRYTNRDVILSLFPLRSATISNNPRLLGLGSNFEQVNVVSK